jgi:hypothetical protein
MSEKVNLANAIVDRMLHPESEFRKKPEDWKPLLENICKQGVDAASAAREDPEALGIAAAAMRLCAVGRLNTPSEVVELLLKAVNRAEEVSKL